MLGRRMSRGMAYRLLYNFHWTFWGFRNHFPLWTTRSQELIRGTGGLVYNLAHSMAMHKVRFKTKSWGKKRGKRRKFQTLWVLSSGELLVNVASLLDLVLVPKGNHFFWNKNKKTYKMKIKKHFFEHMNMCNKYKKYSPLQQAMALICNDKMTDLWIVQLISS